MAARRLVEDHCDLPRSSDAEIVLLRRGAGNTRVSLRNLRPKLFCSTRFQVSTAIIPAIAIAQIGMTALLVSASTSATPLRGIQ